MLSIATWNKYLWVNDIDIMPEAYTISIIVSGQNGVGVRRDSTWIAEQFGARTRIADMSVDSAAEALPDEVEDDMDCGNILLQILELSAECHLALEVNGWDGVSETVCARLSEGGCIVGSYYQSVNMDTICTLARDGVVDRTFDPLLTPPDVTREYERGLPFGSEERTESIIPAVFLLLERYTGIRSITPEIFQDVQWKTYLKQY
jgi:hypothetical protein